MGYRFSFNFFVNDKKIGSKSADEDFQQGCSDKTAASVDQNAMILNAVKCQHQNFVLNSPQVLFFFNSHCIALSLSRRPITQTT